MGQQFDLMNRTFVFKMILLIRYCNLIYYIPLTLQTEKLVGLNKLYKVLLARPKEGPAVKTAELLQYLKQTLSPL